MARIDSLNILLDPSGKDKLAELYGMVMENVEKSALSMIVKNRNLSGDPKSGTVEVKRFANSTSNTYGTARTAGKGSSVKDKPVTVSLDQNKEIIEELEQKDVRLLGVSGLLDLRAKDHIKSMVRELDRAFFTASATKGTAKILTATSVTERAEELLVSLETVKNDYVDGVDRDMIHLFVSPTVYSKMRNAIDTDVNNANINTAMGEMGMYHGAYIYSCLRLPTGYDMVAMVEGAVAQPLMSNEYKAEPIPLSDAIAVELFFYYGTEVVMPDLCLAVATPAVTPPTGG